MGNRRPSITLRKPTSARRAFGTRHLQMQDLRTIIEAVLNKAPAWIRNDLPSDDMQIRLRAEEALAAMIEAALADQVR